MTYLENEHPYIRSGNRALRATQGGPWLAAGGVVPDGLGSEETATMDSWLFPASSQYNIDQARPAAFVKDQYQGFSNDVHAIYGPVRIKQNRFAAHTKTIVHGGTSPKVMTDDTKGALRVNSEAIKGIRFDKSHVTTIVRPDQRTILSRLQAQGRIDNQIRTNQKIAQDAHMDEVRARYVLAQVKGNVSRSDIGVSGRNAIGAMGDVDIPTPPGPNNTKLLLGLGIVALLGVGLMMGQSKPRRR